MIGRSPRLDSPAVVLTAAIGLTLYALILASPQVVSLAQRIIGGSQESINSYGLRFAASAVLLGLAPVVVLRASGARSSDIGLRKARRIRPTLLLFACVIAVSVGVLSSRNTELATFYPFGRPGILEIARSPLWIFGHSLSYLVFYYLPWEITFRGVLLFPLIPRRGAGASGVLLAVTPQAIASTLLHIGHPSMEIAAALPFGLALGLLAVRTGSILPGLLIHAGVGIALDVAIMVTSF